MKQYLPLDGFKTVSQFDQLDNKEVEVLVDVQTGKIRAHTPELFEDEAFEVCAGQLTAANLDAPVAPFWLNHLDDQPVSTFYQCNARTSISERIEAARTFLSAEEFGFAHMNTLSTYDAVEGILQAKVVMYAAAFIKGATNGGYLYGTSRTKLLTWYSIFNGAKFVGGVLVEGEE